MDGLEEVGVKTNFGEHVGCGPASICYSASDTVACEGLEMAYEGVEELVTRFDVDVA